MEKTDSFVKHSESIWTLAADWQETAFRRRMTVMKSSQGGLVVHSAINLPDHQWVELGSFGEVEAIVIPNVFHDSEAPIYAERFPSAEIFAPESSVKKIQKRCPKSRVRSLEGDWEASRWAKDIRCIPVQGLRIVDESVFFHAHSATLVLCDLAFHMDSASFKGLERIIMKWNRIGQGFGPSRLGTSFFIKDNLKASKSFKEIAALPFDRVIVNHGEIIEADGKTQFLKGFKSFL